MNLTRIFTHLPPTADATTALKSDANQHPNIVIRHPHPHRVITN
jgi:hypothetical protein